MAVKFVSKKKKQNSYLSFLKVGDCFYLVNGNTLYQKAYDKINDKEYMLEMLTGHLWPVSVSAVVEVDVELTELT